MYAFFVEMIGVLDCETREEPSFNSECNLSPIILSRTQTYQSHALSFSFLIGDMFVYSLNQSPLDLHIKLDACNNLS